MTTATTNTVVDHTSDAGFRTWVAEVITMLVSTLGVTQTADTGQINTATVTRPGTAVSGGYSILRFNDTAQATSPIFFKLEYGTGASATTPMMWITVGTGSNGSGTITGTVMTKVSCGGNTNTSSVTAYATRGCYNTTAGFLGFVWKIGAPTATINEAMAGFAVYRSSDNTGAVTTDAVNLLTNSSTLTVNGGGLTGWFQAISYLNSTAYSTAPFPSSYWGVAPFGVSVTLFSGNVQVFPVFQYTPVLGITPWLGMVVNGELAQGNTASITLVGSTPHTYLSVGSGVCGSTVSLTNASWGCSGGSAGSFSMIMLWE